MSLERPKEPLIKVMVLCVLGGVGVDWFWQSWSWSWIGLLAQGLELHIYWIVSLQASDKEP